MEMGTTIPKRSTLVGRRGTRVWKVRCTNCGAEHEKPTAELNVAKTCSCCFGMSKGQAGFKLVWDQYMWGAQKNGRDFTLTPEEVRTITSSPCCYCGLPPSRLSTTNRSHIPVWGSYWFNGIDRKDNSLGYVAGNCLPCCWTCNRAKGTMTHEEFLQYLRRVARYHGLAWAC